MIEVQWKNCKLGDVLTLQRGFDLPKKKRRAGNIPIVSSSGVSGYHDTAKVAGPGVVTGRYGTLGEVFYIEGDFWPLNTTLYVREYKGNDPLFLSYFLRTLDLAHQNAAGAVPGLNRNALHMLPVKVPALSIQRKIANVLAAYDDLIENNARRIEILEEMAQAIYREWFVNFRFPGHEKVGMVDSELGPLPEGWEVRKLGDACTVVMGQSPKSEYYNDKGEGLPFHQGVKDFGPRFPTDRLYCTMENRVAEAGDILFSVRAPVGRINLTAKKMVIGRGLSAIRSMSGNQAFTFQQLRDAFEEEDSIGGGTIFKAVTKSDMLGIKLIQPEDSLVERFQAVVRPMFREIENLTARNSNLRRTRDLLLPKLVSGEVDVGEARAEVASL